LKARTKRNVWYCWCLRCSNCQHEVCHTTMDRLSTQFRLLCASLRRSTNTVSPGGYADSWCLFSVHR
jgi:hypothetical protein